MDSGLPSDLAVKEERPGGLSHLFVDRGIGGRGSTKKSPAELPSSLPRYTGQFLPTQMERGGRGVFGPVQDAILLGKDKPPLCLPLLLNRRISGLAPSSAPSKGSCEQVETPQHPSRNP